jgi:hypothetical protein
MIRWEMGRLIPTSNTTMRMARRRVKYLKSLMNRLRNIKGNGFSQN